MGLVMLRCSNLMDHPYYPYFYKKVIFEKVSICSEIFEIQCTQWGESLITMYKTRSNLLCIYISESLLPVYHWLRKGIVIKLETQLWCSDSNIVNTVSLVIIVDYIMIKTRDFVAQCTTTTTTNTTVTTTTTSSMLLY